MQQLVIMFHTFLDFPYLSLTTSGPCGKSMCCAFLLYRAHQQLLLLLAFNRDEILERWQIDACSYDLAYRVALQTQLSNMRVTSCCRPTQPAEFWEDHRQLLAGRDLQRKNGGTWLGVTKRGRFAFVTNYREVQAGQLQPGALSGRNHDANCCC